MHRSVRAASNAHSKSDEEIEACAAERFHETAPVRTFFNVCRCCRCVAVFVPGGTGGADLIAEYEFPLRAGAKHLLGSLLE